MLVIAETSISIRTSAEELWDYAWDPEHWTASNPEEHFGLEFHTADNRPAAGATFRQRESVAGAYADMTGHFLVVERPKMLVWAGVARYPLLKGVLNARIPEGGVIRVVDVDDGVRISHDVYMDFPQTPLGKLLYRLFTGRLEGQKAVYEHTYKELAYFKSQLESAGSSAV
ncbi:MAG: hypothetical protein ABIS84_14500 [Arachnia sp.]